ncbi:MerC domain-containing protein [Bradyrhizobium sp. ARR65]|uniref:MerC domain-containing protein n=1 Tax=Bradyrhizobium sp. ARR65 TaxID=1040989 RepID=UPI0004661CFC|nr:MerC domain-containing protein [Bradyrhizobium sp. ARR65]
MTISVSHADEGARGLRGPLPLWVLLSIYALFVVAGNRLLIDPDTLWQVTIGQWIIDHRAVPQVDVYSFTMRGEPWISTQWLAQVIYAKAFALAGWTGPVVVAAFAIAVTFALFARSLSRDLSDSTTLVFVAAALALTAPHLFARPHVLAMPVMVAWIAGLVAAADRHEPPSFWLLPLMALWANLHGGFVFGLMIVAPIALDALVSAAKTERRWLLLRWAMFGLGALLAACCTPYGWNSLLASQKILALGSALPLIMEWKPADFGHLGPLELCLLLGIGLALYRGVTLPPMRIVILLGLLHMALAQGRAAEILALVAPLILAAPLARQIGGAGARDAAAAFPRGTLIAALALVMAAGTFAYAAVHRFEPNMRGAPVAAVTELKKLNLARVFNDYDFGGYLIYRGVRTFIDGRTELYGEKFFVDHNAASGLMEPDNLFRLLDQYDIQATLMRTQSAATKLLDHMDGWQNIYSDDIATIHLRKAGATHTREPAIDPEAN